MDFAIYVANLTLIMAVLLVGQQLLLFDCGVLSLGTAAFFAMGAYGSALLAKSGAMSVPAAIALAALGSTGLAIVICAPFLKLLRGDFFALATLGLAQATLVVIRGLAPGGVSGMGGIPGLHSPLAALLPTSLQWLILNALFLSFGFLLVLYVRRQRMGMLIHALRLDENALTALGYRSTLLKVEVFAISAFLASAAGAMQAHYIGAVEPRMCSIQTTVLILCGTILSGRRSVWGTLIGSVFLVGVPTVLQELFSGEIGSQWRVFPLVQISYGCLIILVTFVLFPRSRSAIRTEVAG